MCCKCADDQTYTGVDISIQTEYDGDTTLNTWDKPDLYSNSIKSIILYFWPITSRQLAFFWCFLDLFRFEGLASPEINTVGNEISNLRRFQY